jgi:hypothetical protein
MTALGSGTVEVSSAVVVVSVRVALTKYELGVWDTPRVPWSTRGTPVVIADPKVILTQLLGPGDVPPQSLPLFPIIRSVSPLKSSPSGVAPGGRVEVFQSLGSLGIVEVNENTMFEKSEPAPPNPSQVNDPAPVYVTGDAVPIVQVESML